MSDVTDSWYPLLSQCKGTYLRLLLVLPPSNAAMLQGLRKTNPNGQEEGRTARSGLRPTDKSVAMQRTSSSQVGLDDSLKVLVSH